MFNLDDITIKNDDCAYKTLVIGKTQEKHQEKQTIC